MNEIPQQKNKATGWRNYLKTHKWLTAGIVVVIIILGFITYKVFAKTGTQTTYVFAPVTQGTLISSISGTGQIIASSSVDIKPEGTSQSATVTEVDVSVGQEVTAGQKIAVIYDQNVTSALVQARSNAENAQANYDKVVGGSNTPEDIAASQLAITQAQQNLINSIDAQYTAINNMIHTNADQFFTNAETFSPEFGITFNDPSTGSPITLTASDENQNLNLDGERTNMNAVLSNWQTAISQATSPDDALALASTSQSYLEQVQSFTTDLVSVVDSISLSAPKYQSTINSYKSTAASAATTASNAITTVVSGAQAVQNAQSNLAVKQAPPLSEDVETAKAQLDSAQASLQTAETNYSNDTIKAPFAGKIAAVDVTVGDQPSNTGSASPDVIATLITDQLVAQVSLNEVDAAKVTVGDPATLTFDALPDITLTGKVIEIDTIGTVSQGVVSYNADIALDANNSSLRPGMSVTASVITDQKSDVLLVPVSAVKISGSTSYVQTAQIPSSEVAAAESTGITLSQAPAQQVVTVGDSNDTQVEIVSGLNAGDEVVTKTTTGTVQTSAASSQTGSGLRALTGGGGGGFGGGAARPSGSGAAATAR